MDFSDALQLLQRNIIVNRDTRRTRSKRPRVVQIARLDRAV